MKALLPMIILSLLLSCKGRNEQKSNNNKNLDSLAIIENQKQAEIKELSKIAYNDVKFGMTKSEVLQTEVFKGGNIVNDGEDYISSLNEIPIGIYSYKMEARFYQNSLFKVIIKTYPQTAEYIETELWNYANNLNDVISLKYGEPEPITGAMVDIVKRQPTEFDFISKYQIIMYMWDIGDKRIWIKMLNRNGKYYVQADITYKPIFDKVFESINNNTQMEIEKDKQKQQKDATKF